MNRRDLLALAAGLPFVGRFFKKPEPEPVELVHVFESFDEMARKLRFDRPITATEVRMKELEALLCRCDPPPFVVLPTRPERCSRCRRPLWTRRQREVRERALRAGWADWSGLRKGAAKRGGLVSPP